MSHEARLTQYPDAPCMPCMPTLGWFGGSMQAYIPYMECLGYMFIIIVEIIKGFLGHLWNQLSGFMLLPSSMSQRVIPCDSSSQICLRTSRFTISLFNSGRPETHVSPARVVTSFGFHRRPRSTAEHQQESGTSSGQAPRD